MNQLKYFTKTRLAIALSIATGIPVYAQQTLDQHLSGPSCDHDCSEIESGRMDYDARLINRAVPINTENRLPNETITLHALPPVETAQTTSKQVTENQTHSAGNSLNFRSGDDQLEETAALDQLVQRLLDKQNVRLRVIGHADSQRLSPATKARFGDNQGLSEARAKKAATYLQAGLHLQTDAIDAIGMGDSKPIASNATKEGMARNRRVEIQIWYDEIVEIAVPESGPAMNRSLICNDEVVAHSQAGEDGFRISVDGQPMSEPTRDSENRQRCVDVALAEEAVQLQYDNTLMAKPFLNVTATPATADEADEIHFQGYSNYLGWIEKAEVRIFNPTDSSRGEPLAIIPLDQHLQGNWSAADRNALKIEAKKLEYRIRVYDKNDRFDETSDLPLWLVDQHRLLGDEADQATEALAGYGENHLALYNIDLTGGTLTVNGKNVPENHAVYFMGSRLPTNAEGKFVGQQIVPPGVHNVEIAVLDESGNGQLFWRELNIKEDNWFYVGLADFTVGRNHTTGPAALVTNDQQHFNNDIYADGRLAFYAKGKWRGKYTITTSADSFEQPVEDLFSNVDHKDPKSLLRRLDEEDHYPVYGDDSTIVDDAPTQGKFFAKIEDERSHLMWGNFRTRITATDLAQIQRGLYGAHLLWNSHALTSDGERRTVINGFAAEPGTLASWEEFRGTGGSLFYLQHQDVTQGSEQIRIEIRDKDSGLVLATEQLVAGQDYDLDTLQGRILLTQPLSSTADDELLIRNGSLHGHPAYLVANYEYTPGLSELDEMAFGGRASHWFNDHVRIGLTASHQQQQGSDQDLQGLDLTLRKTAETYVKVEAARTDGAGVGGQQSLTGGFEFSQLEQDRRAGIDADAYRAEAAVKLSDVGMQNDGKITAYAQKREAGFSAPGQLTQYDTDQYGASLTTPLSENTDAKVKIDSHDEKGGTDMRALEANIQHQLNSAWSVSAGVRHDKRTQTQNLNTNPNPELKEGDRTDLALQATYSSDNDWETFGFVQGTVDRDETRQENNRYGVGGRKQLNDRLDLNGEVSGGNGGLGAKVGSDYRLSDRSDVYLGYELDPDRTDNLTRGRNGQLVSGMKHRYSDALSVFGEGRYQHGQHSTGLTHAYGLDYAPIDHWTFGINFETGKLNQDETNWLDRTAVALTAGFQQEATKLASALEYRKDKTQDDARTSWLMRNNLAYQVTQDWRTQARLDFAFSESDQGNLFNSDYTEAVLGFAYRPVKHDRFNMLAKYTYLMDLAPFDQFTSAGSQGQNQQRSHVLSLDAMYDLNTRWTIGGKYAYRLGELRQGRDQGNWFDSEAHLYIARLDWHVVRQWDLMLEGRMLDLTAADDRRLGAVAGLYRHLNENFKLGVGYSLADFSDDLTDQDYTSQGWFLNFVGKL